MIKFPGSFQPVRPSPLAETPLRANRANDSKAEHHNSTVQKHRLHSNSAGHGEQHALAGANVERQQPAVAAAGQNQSVTTVSLSYESRTQGHAFLADGVEKYRAIGQSEKTSAASTILTFIDAQIRRDVADGATPEELASRLQSGLDGFLKGYGEAFEQIEAMGMLVDGVKQAVTQTYNDVMSGIAKLAKELEISPPEGLPDEAVQASSEPSSSPVPAGGAAESLVSGPASVLGSLSSSEANTDEKNSAIIARLREQQTETRTRGSERASSSGGETVAQAGSRSYSFQLQTQDGDVVTIEASSKYGVAAHNNGSGVGYASYNRDNFSFSVSGELDDGELAAISDLLSQVNDVAEVFFSGDAYAAFEQVQQLGFDESEIAQFALNLQQTRVTQVENTYRDVENAGDNGKRAALPMNIVGEFVQKLQILHDSLREMGVNYEIAGNLLDMIGQTVSDENGEKLEPFVDRMSQYL